ncbi:MAG: DUF1579 family protein [Anaerolineales bacterium]
MEDAHEFLNRLVGEWMLTGEMGEVELRQHVQARWVLGNRFLWMHCKSETGPDNPTADYEAIYHFGYNRAESLFVMHLLDTTEVPTTCVLGRGRRDGDHVPFLFEYGDTDFFNTLSWYPERDAWTFHQTYREDGEVRTFATKELSRLE